MAPQKKMEALGEFLFIAKTLGKGVSGETGEVGNTAAILGVGSMSIMLLFIVTVLVKDL